MWTYILISNKTNWACKILSSHSSGNRFSNKILILNIPSGSHNESAIEFDKNLVTYFNIDFILNREYGDTSCDRVASNSNISTAISYRQDSKIYANITEYVHYEYKIFYIAEANRIRVIYIYIWIYQYQPSHRLVEDRNLSRHFFLQKLVDVKLCATDLSSTHERNI